MRKEIYLTNARSLIEYDFADWNLPSFSLRDVQKEGKRNVPEDWVYMATVDFNCPPLTREFLAASALRGVDAEIERTRVEAQKKVIDLERERNKILRLGNSVIGESVATRNNSGADDVDIPF